MPVRIHPMVCGWLEVARNILAKQPGRWRLLIPSGHNAVQWSGDGSLAIEL